MTEIKLYAAPMEGLTTPVWRQVHAALFGGADKYFTPFLSPNANRSFQHKELREVENGAGLPLVPQLLTNRSEYFIWGARTLADMGYREINFNLGCPSGTVCAKHKGAGMLADPAALDACLGEIMAAVPEVRISVKTRLGGSDVAEWPALAEVYGRHALSELIVHPRVRREQYGGEVHRDVFETIRGPWPLIYNGDLRTPEDIAAIRAGCPDLAGVMAGRGLIADPALFRRYRGGPAATAAEMRRYHDALLEGYADLYAGQQEPVLHKMWELWAWLQDAYVGAAEYRKPILKAKTLSAYRAAAEEIMAACPLRWER